MIKLDTQTFRYISDASLLTDIEPYLGQITYLADTQELYVYNGDKWILMQAANEVNDDMNLYEMNQNMVKQLPVLEITEKELNMINQLHTIHGNQYYMLLCNDMKYYTILKTSTTWAIMPSTCETLGLTVVDCLKNVGDIKSIDFVPDNSAIEIWLENSEGVYCMYLFPYSEGVVEFRG